MIEGNKAHTAILATSSATPLTKGINVFNFLFVKSIFLAFKNNEGR